MPLLPSSVETWLAVQLASRVQMFLPFPTAASLAPSLENVMSNQLCVESMPVSSPGSTSVHVTPESGEVQMFPPLTTAASLVKSSDEVMLLQFLLFVASY